MAIYWKYECCTCENMDSTVGNKDKGCCGTIACHHVTPEPCDKTCHALGLSPINTPPGCSEPCSGCGSAVSFVSLFSNSFFGNGWVIGPNIRMLKKIFKRIR